MKTIAAFLDAKISIKYVLALLLGLYLTDFSIKSDSVSAIPQKKHDQEHVFSNPLDEHVVETETEAAEEFKFVADSTDMFTPANLVDIANQHPYQDMTPSADAPEQLTIMQLEAELAIKDFELYMQAIKNQDGKRVSAAKRFSDEPIDHQWAQRQEQKYGELFNEDALSIYPFENTQCRSNQCATKVFLQSDDEIHALSEDLNSVLDKQSQGHGALPVMIERDPDSDHFTVYIARTLKGFNLSGAK
ncbi:hypothetical protein [Pseudoalteromonas luteoviolacea]|uniref:Uncharacterized protein n=1 Tax=Pseudoalteromonas luteoviolacea H33 TaxID=1365251 RepID=A0A167FKV0_9GAMM|nr:hypothetical protein [Pseudoalteromonas luteoviolacea]KZN52458.1 hypothetical protein N476_10365 [Pseudoalteromonas luteoviolacea H33]KZN76610.1 hypothetical protein N477_15990 [Pseudoalteromonas luteoviolacea H33-S]MBQ4877105.1 hypothetical protein [Pseudoalteromonas luteoviolacea]MBQ4905966.1 hypothetical protein [Pseudoalteromonas luteoviolacea]